MSKYWMRIELLSDMCAADGGIYNSSVDVDVCHDAYGFPYIPAKRIRGCLRECAIELQDWGEEIQWKKLFGQGGRRENGAKVRIGNAVLENYVEMRRLAETYSEHIVFHPQNILNHFTYVRTQTAIDQETGVAEKASLRTVRVVNKGLVFWSEIEMMEEDREDLKKCCAVFRNIGLSRSRGLGEIDAALYSETERKDREEKGVEDEKIKSRQGDAADDRNASGKIDLEGAEVLHYELFLEEPVICKSINGGEARTQDYIEGSKMLGLLFEHADSQEEVRKMLEMGELFCSNAYISEKGRRYLEVPAYLYEVKNDKEHYVNKLYPEPDCVEEDQMQLNGMKHCYVYLDNNQVLEKRSVQIEERYHHRRPEDKSIGRVAKEESGESRFYQISSIEAGQTFRGYFKGNPEQIKWIYEILSQNECYHIGYSRNSEYGKVRLNVSRGELAETVTKKVKRFCVKLEAPAIVYNENAFYSTNAQDLIAEVNSVLGIQENEMVKAANIRRYIKYVTVGGYQAAWNCCKPTNIAFDKGTTLLYTLEKEIEMTIPGLLLLGERVTEGYGEATIQILDELEKPQCLQEIANEKKKSADAGQLLSKEVDVRESAFIRQLCEDLFRTYIKMKAAENAERSGLTSAARATVSNMILMCKELEQDAFESVKKECRKRFEKTTDQKEEKLDYANRILNCAEKETEEVKKAFEKEYCLSGFDREEGADRKFYLESYLKQLKYKFRKESAQKEKAERAAEIKRTEKRAQEGGSAHES